jgi:hypothetical protein
MAAVIVIAIRLFLPPSILRWPLAGGILCLLVDAIDVILVDTIATLLGEPPEFGPAYAQIDKWLDIWYLGLEAVVVRRWPEVLLRRTTLVLFGWRLIGVVLFEITLLRPLLLVFPNLFENVYLFALVARRWFPALVPTTPVSMAIVVAVLLVPKLVQEWVLHWEELHPWQWLRQLILGPSLPDSSATLIAPRH